MTVPGSLKCVKAIGWYIEEYCVAQISINLTNLSVTPLHIAFDECCKKADARGVRVTGSELVGLVPLQAMLDAGRYFLKKQQRSVGVSDKELLKIAVKSLGLNDLYPFKPEEKIIEYAIAVRSPEPRASARANPTRPLGLIDRSVQDFVEETASESPAPGGGSVAAAIGALGAALATMVANLSAHKRGWDDRWEEFSDWAEKGKQHYVELLRLVDEDTSAFESVMAAYGLPQSSDVEKIARKQAIQEATKRAIEIPLKVMEASLASMEVIKAMAETGNPNSVSDAGVAALCARTAVLGAFLNVKINAGNLGDKGFVTGVLARGEKMKSDAIAKENKILESVAAKM